MFTIVIIAITATTFSFLIHHFVEHILTKGGRRPVRLTFGRYHIHHSCLGLMAILTALVITGSAATAALFGFGIGNIWHHKRTHNAANEKGLVFISRITNFNLSDSN